MREEIVYYAKPATKAIYHSKLANHENICSMQRKNSMSETKS